MPIRQLAPDVAAKIAAGEVVERPASVVKELIENSIDAGATQIRVDLSHGGLQLIRITDNGYGIPATELPLALERHATSKVAQIDDLEHIRSLGFRGEALASIAAVAEVTLLSRPRGAEQGAQIAATSGQLSPVTTAAASEGTTITVRNLFSAVPARLKFLKSRNTEVSHCHHLLEQYALAYPEIRFSVFSDGRQIFATPGDGKLLSVLMEVYGLQVAEQMMAISSAERPDDTGYPIVSGYVSRPTCYKSTRQHISFFVNRRWVLSRMLTSAVEGAYHSLLLSGRHPIAVVNVQLDPSLLDVNVHPAKTEIRFLKERRVFAAILRAVRQALLEEPEMPQWEPSRSSSDLSVPEQQAGKEQILDLSMLDTQDVEAKEEVSTSEESDETPAFPMDSPWLTVNEEESGTKPPLSARLWQSHIRGNANDADAQPVECSGRAEKTISPAKQQTLTRAIVEKQEPASLPATGDASAVPISKDLPLPPATERLEEQISSRSSLRRSDDWLPQRTQEPLTAPEAQTIEQQRRLPRLRVVGQVAQSYIVTEGEDGMYLVDQHAAHERILLERMVAALKARTPLSQLLLTPLRLELAPNELEAIEEYQQQLEHIGFSMNFGNDGVLEIMAVPNVLVKQMNSSSLHELLVSVTSEESLGHTETWEERALANVACKAAIKANYFLTVSEMREMLEQLEGTKAPYSCCHGRPTMVHFSQSALARAFERR